MDSTLNGNDYFPGGQLNPFYQGAMSQVARNTDEGLKKTQEMNATSKRSVNL